jgi:S1-C subfamily serine protease
MSFQFSLKLAGKTIERRGQIQQCQGGIPMSRTYDPPRPGVPVQTSPRSPWPGGGSYGYQGSGYGTDDPGGGRYGPDSPYGAGPYGYGGPSGPGGPHGHGYGGGGGGQGPRGHIPGFRRGALILAVALAAGLGAFFGVGGNSAATGAVLTTSQIETRVDPGLVDVVSTLSYQQAESAGTGQVLTPSGEVLTNNHVIEGATSIMVTDVGNGHTYKAKVVGYDQTRDVAVLQLQGASGLRTVTIGNSGSAAVGQKVVALGNAGGKGGTPAVATGVITGLNASIAATDQASGTVEHLTGMINDNAPIQAGDSGGPLVNSAGRVIGMDTAASSGHNGFQIQGKASRFAAFAIPANEATGIAKKIEAGNGSSTVHIGATGFLGVEVQSTRGAAGQGVPAGSGALVAGVIQGTPAASAGLAQGDVITSVDGRSVSSPSALQAALEHHHPGDRVRVGWTSQVGLKHSATLTLAKGPAA